MAKGESWSQDIYGAYVAAVSIIPRQRGKARRTHINYQGFLTYAYMLRRLGLIEYIPGADTLEVPGEAIKTDVPYNPNLISKRHYVRLVPDRLGDPAWNNPRLALYPHHGH